MKEDRFCVCFFFKFEREEPRASWSYVVQALEIVDGPRSSERWVILEHHYSFANHAYFRVHYFSSEEALKRGFAQGLAKWLSKEIERTKRDFAKKSKKKKTLKRTFTEFLRDYEEFNNPTSPFDGSQGILRTVRLPDFVTPWFLAKKGERFRGDKVSQKPHRIKRVSK